MTTTDTMTTTAEIEVAWDLSDLFTSPDDPQMEKTLKASAERAAAFAREYQGKIDSPDLTAHTLASAIQEYESFWQEAGKPGTYARPAFFCRYERARAEGALLSKVQEMPRQSLSLPLVFFKLELAGDPGRDAVAPLA